MPRRQITLARLWVSLAAAIIVAVLCVSLGIVKAVDGDLTTAELYMLLTALVASRVVIGIVGEIGKRLDDD